MAKCSLLWLVQAKPSCLIGHCGNPLVQDAAHSVFAAPVVPASNVLKSI